MEELIKYIEQNEGIEQRATQVVVPTGIEHTYEHSYNFPSGMDRLIAVAVYVDDNDNLSPLTTIGIGVESNTEAVYPTSYKNYADGANGKYLERFKPVNVDASGNEMTIRIKPNAALVKDIKMIVHLIFLKRNICK